MWLEFTGRIETGDPVLDVGIERLVFARAPDGQEVLYASTGGQGGVAAWRLGDGLPAKLDRLYFPNWMADATVGALAFLETPDGLRALIGGVGGDSLLSLTVDAAGRLSRIDELGRLAWNTEHVADMLVVNGNQIVVSDTGSDLVSSLALGDNGYKTVWSNGREVLNGGGDLDALHLGQDTFVVATEPDRDGIAVFSISDQGALLRVSSLGRDDGLGVSQPTAITTVEAWEQGWVIAGANGTNTVTVARVDPLTGLDAIAHHMDTRDTRFGATQALASETVAGWTFVVAAGGDDGLGLFTLLPDGRLVHLESVAHQLGLGLMDVRALSMTVTDGALQVFAASEDGPGLSRFAFDVGGLESPVINDRGGAQRLEGGAGRDLLISSAGRDTLSGGGGDDVLVGGPDGAVLSGGAGADLFVVTARAGTTEIQDFTLGEDRLDLSSWSNLRGPAQLNVEPQWDGAHITYGDATVVVEKTGRGLLDAENLFGPSFSWPDTISIIDVERGLFMQGKATSDRLRGEETDDTISGGAGADNITGDAGADWVEGGSGHDKLFGNEGSDTLLGQGGDDVLWGIEDKDHLVGHRGQDTIWGGGGRDFIIGNQGDDFLSGGGWADEVIGGSGQDSLFGDGGRDLLRGNGGHDRLDGGSGADRLFGHAGRDQLFGGGGSDRLHGGGGKDKIDGGGGHDRLIGAKGDDRLFGGNGRDTLLGNSGDDQLFSGHGRDTLLGHAGNDRLDGGGGRDRVVGGSGDDHLSGNSGPDRLIGESGADTLNGGSGDDRLIGGTNSDTLNGKKHDDTINGGSGHDTMRGGPGDDLILARGGHDFLNGGEGRDVLIGDGGRDTVLGEGGDDKLSAGQGNDTVLGGRGTDTLIGGDGHDALFGGGGHDRLSGGNGDDTLWGGGGDDRIEDAEGEAVLRGGVGDDTISGSGDDTLIGGAGADTFVFNAEPGTDVIEDFQQGEDVIDLTPLQIDGFGSLTRRNTETGTDLILGEAIVRIEDVRPWQLDPDDFLF